MGLIETCSNKGIQIIGFSDESMAHLLKNAMNISADASKDVRLLSNCRNSFGKPFTSYVPSLSLTFGDTIASINGNYIYSLQLQSTMFECMILNDFDLNANDKNNGETIIFDLIRQNNVSLFSLLLLLCIEVDDLFSFSTEPLIISSSLSFFAVFLAMLFSFPIPLC